MNKHLENLLENGQKSFIILSKNAGFYKIQVTGVKNKQNSDLTINVSEKSFTELEQQKGIKIVDSIQEKSVEPSKNDDNLRNLRKADLLDLAKRSGLDPADESMTKEQLIEYINKNNK